MPIVTIDPQRCKKDGLCVRICEKVFEQKLEGSVPVVLMKNTATRAATAYLYVLQVRSHRRSVRTKKCTR